MNTSTWEKIVPLSFESKAFDNARERIVIYPKASDIVMIEGDDNYSTVFFTPAYQQSLSNAISKTTNLKMSKTLKFFEEKLQEYGCFFRCSRGAIVNLHYVRLLKSRTIYLHSLEKVVFLSGNLVPDFKSAMDQI